jgi:peptidoglycan/LPS O-acetylase OafA/YrhL
MEPLPLVGLLALTLGVDLLIASATYRWIEVPARAWLRKRSIPVDRAHAIVTERHVAVTEEVNP